jgi:hypothetical protein
MLRLRATTAAKVGVIRPEQLKVSQSHSVQESKGWYLQQQKWIRPNRNPLSTYLLI